MKTDIKNLIHQGFSNNLRTLQTNAVLFAQNEKLWNLMNCSFDATKKVLDATDKEDLSELDFAKLMILTNCLSDLVAVTHNLQLGLFRPAGTILRGVVENVSLAVAIHQKPEIYKQYVAGKYHVPHSVTLAKKFISEIGKVNGLLSNLFTHEPYMTIGRGLRVSGKSMEIMLIPGVDQEDGRTFSIIANITALSALMMGESIEWCLAAHLESFIFWEKINDDHLKVKSSELKSTAISMSKELEQLLAEK